MQRHVAAADRRRAGAAVGLQHVAVDGDLHLAQHRQVGDRAQRAADQALDLLGAARLLALGRLAVVALRRGAREHRVLGGDPAAALAPQPRRHALLDRRGAQHPRLAELDQHRAGRELREVTRERQRAQVVGLAPVTSDAHWISPGGVQACSRMSAGAGTGRGQMVVTRPCGRQGDAGAERLGALLDGRDLVDHRPEVGEDQALRRRLPRRLAGLLGRQVDRGGDVVVQVGGLRQHEVGAGGERAHRPLGTGVGGVDHAPPFVGGLDRVRGRRVVGAAEAQVDVADGGGVAVAHARASRRCRPSRTPGTGGTSPAPRARRPAGP